MQRTHNSKKSTSQCTNHNRHGNVHTVQLTISPFRCVHVSPKSLLNVSGLEKSDRAFTLMARRFGLLVQGADGEQIPLDVLQQGRRRVVIIMDQVLEHQHQTTDSQGHRVRQVPTKKHSSAINDSDIATAK